ncbi:MAG: hypothetical protein K2P94_11100 [Rhodospirillaceae bacterium]|nr:hypothetical protein [Rhodospirillaceae bacterium]
MAMGDFSILGMSYARQHDRYGNLLSRAKPVEEAAPVTEELPTPEDVPPAPAVEISPYAGFGGVISAMGMNTFMPNGGSAADAINEAVQFSAPFILNPELAAQLIGNQTQEPPSAEAVAGAMNALDRNYDLSDPIALFKQLQIPGAGQILPWDLHRAVAAGGGTMEEAAALVKQLDRFGNGAITIQQLMANLPALPGAEPAEPAESVAPTPDPVRDSALGGLGALAATYNVSQPQDLFLELDTDFDGLLTRSDIEAAVAAGGGSVEAGAALYAQLDPGNTGGVTQAQFASNLFPRIELPNFFV